MLAARGLARVLGKTPEQRQVTVTPMTSRRNQLRDETPRDRVYVMVVNFSHEEIELPKATVLGVAEETSASVVAHINDAESQKASGNREFSLKTHESAIDSSFRQYLSDKLGHLTQEKRTVWSQF